jgi:hypothetical protein
LERPKIQILARDEQSAIAVPGQTHWITWRCDSSVSIPWC